MTNLPPCDHDECGPTKCKREPTNLQKAVETNMVTLLKDAQAIVEQKCIFRKFVSGTPLTNDIAVWMAEFAAKQVEALQSELKQEKIWKEEDPRMLREHDVAFQSLFERHKDLTLQLAKKVKENEKLKEALKEIDDDLKENMPEYERLDSTGAALSHPLMKQILEVK